MALRLFFAIFSGHHGSFIPHPSASTLFRRIFVLSTLVTAITLALVISFLCSLMEAVLYTITASQLEMLKKKGHPSADLLISMRSDINGPITAILTMNTLAHTVGATVAGASAAMVLGENNLFLFSAVFTLAILILSEIIPKTIGVTYAVRLAPLIARPLYLMVISLKPAIWLCQVVTRLIPQNKDGGHISSEELRTIASLSRKSGQIEPDQERVINNILLLGHKTVRQVMTPRTDTLKLEAMFSRHSRIPLYHDTPNDVTGIVLRKDILLAAAEQKNSLPLSQLMNPVHFVPETAPLNRVLVDFYERHQHLFIVVDEYGAMTGIIAMEDILEEIVGREIMDESDKAKNMRELARRQYKETTEHAKDSQTEDMPL
jgi:CBS domain containing-hemolysin-like protein